MSDDIDQIRAKLAAERGAAEAFAQRVADWASELDKEVSKAEQIRHVMPRALRNLAEETQQAERSSR